MLFAKEQEKEKEIDDVCLGTEISVKRHWHVGSSQSASSAANHQDCIVANRTSCKPSFLCPDFLQWLPRSRLSPSYSTLLSDIFHHHNRRHSIHSSCSSACLYMGSRCSLRFNRPQNTQAAVSITGSRTFSTIGRNSGPRNRKIEATGLQARL